MAKTRYFAGRQKSLFSGALIGQNSLFCFTLIACNFEICAAHRRSLLLLQQAAAQDAARTAVHESSGAVRSRKAQWQALPGNPETGDTYHTSSSREEAAICGEKIENRAKKRIQAAQPPPPATRQQATPLLGGTCTSMLASCCCCCRSVLLLL